MRIDTIEIGPEAIEAVVRFDAGEPMRSSDVPGLADALVHALPGLKGHRCDNGAGLSFRAEAADTELAHLVEHAALEIMAMAGSPDTLRGVTVWDSAIDGRGVFRVRVEYDDDLVALGALRCAAEVVGVLASGGEAPDAAAEARRLRGLRRALPGCGGATG